MAELRLIRAGALALVASTVVAPVASADPTAMVHAPAGWRADAERAAQVAAVAGNHGGVVAIEAYVPDGAGGGAALFVTRVTTPGAHDAGAAVEEFHAAVRRDRLTSTTAVEDRFATHVDGALTIAELASHDPAIHLARAARLVARVDGDRLIAVTGECLVRDDVAAAVVDACKAALQTIEPGSGAAAGPVAAEPFAPPAASPSVMRPLDPARDAPLMPPVDVAPPEASERWRAIVFVAGLALLAALFWINRRRREDLGKRAGPPDDDADALRAAARGDRSDDADDADAGEPKP